jgi:hypothetical protein
MLRDGGPVANLRRHHLYALPRYADVSAALSDWQTFTSASGQAMHDVINSATRNATICTDPPAWAVIIKHSRSKTKGSSD